MSPVDYTSRRGDEPDVTDRCVIGGLLLCGLHHPRTAPNRTAINR